MTNNDFAGGCVVPCSGVATGARARSRRRNRASGNLMAGALRLPRPLEFTESPSAGRAGMPPYPSSSKHGCDIPSLVASPGDDPGGGVQFAGVSLENDRGSRSQCRATLGHQTPNGRGKPGSGWTHTWPVHQRAYMPARQHPFPPHGLEGAHPPSRRVFTRGTRRDF
jgi:hypothetical protein